MAQPKTNEPNGSADSTDLIPLDTYRFVKRMTELGMDERWAAALADEQVRLINTNLATKEDVSNMATKEDVARIESGMGALASKEEIKRLELQIEKLRSELTIRIYAVNGTTTVLIIAIVGWLTSGG